MVNPETGLITREWYRFFLNMFGLTGAGNNDDSILVALVTPPALEPQFDFFPIADARAEQYSDIQTRLEPIVDQLTNLQFAFESQPITIPNITEHNSLSGLQGGVFAEYFHLTSAKYTIANQSANAARDGYLTSADWTTFNSKQGLTTPVTTTADFSVGTENWCINNKSGSGCVVTLPVASTNSGRAITLQNYQAQTLVSVSSNVVPLGGGAAGTAILENVAGNWATLVSDGTNWVMMQYAPNNILLLE